MTRNKGKPLPDEERRYWPTQLETHSDGPLRRIFGLGVAVLYAQPPIARWLF
jgi:hypothetical protein